MVQGIKTYLQNIIKYVKQGGIINVSVSQINFNNCLSDKVVLITGGSSGIGLTTAKKMLACGAKVIITGRNAKKLQVAISELSSENARCIVWDIKDVSSIHNKFLELISIFGRLDIAINNAGIWTPKMWNEITEEDWDRIIDINLKGLYFMCQAEAEYFMHTKSLNKIINVTSMDGIYARFHPYNASKFGANGLTKGLAKTLINNNIIVNAVAPGPCKTDLNKDYLSKDADNYYWSQTLNKRFVLKEEVADMIAYLASDSANSIIGQVISVDGGMTLI